MITTKHFQDWYDNIFSYGYGTGDVYYIEGLKTFFDSLEKDGNGELRSYNYENLEKKLGGLGAWLLINMFCPIAIDIIQYGTSPRYGSLTDKGCLLRDFIKSKTEEELYEIATDDREYYCFPKQCQCDTPCNNPLFSL